MLPFFTTGEETQEGLIEIYKSEIEIYMNKSRPQGSVLEIARLRNKDVIEFVWGSYCYHMGQTNYFWRHGPPPPSDAPEWLKEHLKAKI